MTVEITRADYEAQKRHGYVSVGADGIERLLYLDGARGTVLGPFTIIEEEEA